MTTESAAWITTDVGAGNLSVDDPLALLRRSIDQAHQSLDEMIDPDRLRELGYYGAAMRGLLAAAEVVELLLDTAPARLFPGDLQREQVSKHKGICSERSFLADHGLEQGTGCGDLVHPEIDLCIDTRGQLMGWLYVYVGSGLGGQHLMRWVRNATWWDPLREHSLLEPYGADLLRHWRIVLQQVRELQPFDTAAAIEAASSAFALHHRILATVLVETGVES